VAAPGGPGDAKLPLDDMPANFFAVSATPEGGKQQAFALVTPKNYTRANRALPPHSEAFVSQVHKDPSLCVWIPEVIPCCSL